MMTKCSDRVSQISESKTQKVSALAAELRAAGQDILGFAVGEPDFDTPDSVKEAAIRALKDGFTKYTPVDGVPELKQAIVDKFARENKLEYKTNEIIVSCGAKQAIYNLCQALLNPGDEAIVPSPYWVSYPDIVILAEGRPVHVQTAESNNFKLTPEQLEGAITPRTRLLFINSPCNPSGAVYTRSELVALSEVLLRYPNIFILSDDIYEHLVFGDKPFENIVNVCPALKERTVIVNGVSKAYAMTGWRIGYAVGEPYIITATKKIQSQSTSNATSIAQYAAIEALNNGGDFIQSMKASFAERCATMHEELNTVPGLSCRASAGSFYLFPNAQSLIGERFENDIELVRHLLEAAHVAVVPGSAFGAPGFLRFSFSCGLDVIKDGIGRVRKALG